MTQNYFDIPALSSSGINLYINKGAEYYWASSPFNENRKPQETTPSMIFGSLCHLLLLENEKFTQVYAIAPECDRRTKEGKETFAAFQTESVGKIVITNNQFQEALTLINALKSNDSVIKLLKSGFSEEEITWVEDNISCKAKLDYCRNGLIVDYKTSQDASKDGFAKSIANYGYHRQDIWYRKAYKAKYGKDALGCVFIVQDVSMPDIINIYSISEQARYYAEQEINQAVKEIKDRLITKNWKSNSGKIQDIDLPIWYKQKGGENV